MSFATEHGREGYEVNNEKDIGIGTGDVHADVTSEGVEITSKKATGALMLPWAVIKGGASLLYGGIAWIFSKIKGNKN